MDADCNLLFGVLALQAGLIDNHQFVDACTLWASRKGSSLGALLVERGWANSPKITRSRFRIASRFRGCYVHVPSVPLRHGTHLSGNAWV
jgi:hypothetical protein